MEKRKTQSKKAGESKERFNLYLSESQMRRLRHLAKRNRKSMSNYVVELIQHQLAEQIEMDLNSESDK